MINYEQTSEMLKALADSNRLRIVDMLSEGNKCACDLLKYFDFTQPALSHHMKILVGAGIVTVRKKGTWNHYALNQEFIKNFKSVCQILFTQNKTEEQICENKQRCCKK